MGFGAWAIGGPWRFGWGEVDDDQSIAAIRRAVELGVNWVDTAAVYGLGHSEEVVGRALRSHRTGEEVFVFTKCGRRWEGRPEGVIGNDLRPESIREECELSLRRLGLERIDLYQVHWPDWTTGTLQEEAWGTMAELVDEGKARWIGACNFDVDQLDRCEAVRHVDAVQPPLSLLARGSLATVVPWAAAHGAGVLGYSPLASGMLTGAYDRERIAGLGEDDWRRASPAFSEPLLSKTLRSSRGSPRSQDGSRRRSPRLPSPGCWRSRASPRVSSGRACRNTSPVGWTRPNSCWTTKRSARSARRLPPPGLGRTCRPSRRRTSGPSRNRT